MAAKNESKLAFLSKFEQLFDDETHSDLTIAAGNTKFKVHKNILKLRTSYFEKATNPESGFKEAKDNTVTLEEHSVHAVWRVLKYCYTGDYSDASNTLALGEEDDLGGLKHSRVHALADMLDIPELKELAAEKLEAKLKNQWVTVDFPGVVREVYSTSNRNDTDVRSVLITATKDHMEDLLKEQSFKVVLYEFGDFSGELVVQNVNAAPAKNCTYCGCAHALYCSQCGHYHQENV